MTPTGVVSRDLEGRILAAARDLLVSGGVDAVTMRRVAQRVGVTATALYRYVDSKQDLVDRVVRGAFTRFAECLEAATQQHPRGSLERVRALGEAYIDFALEHQEHFRVIFSMQVPDPRHLDELPGGGGYPLLRQCVVDGMEMGVLRRADPDLVSLYLWSTVHGLVTLTLACQLNDCGGSAALTRSPRELFDAFGPFVRAGLLAPDAAPSDRAPQDGGRGR